MNGTVETPDDWTMLAAEWQDGTPNVTVDASALRRRVDAERRRMRWSLAMEVIMSLLAVAATALTVRNYPGAWSRFLAIDTGVMLVALWTFGIWNTRGTWQPLGQTTEAFLSLARLRCARRLRALWYAALVTALQVVGVTLWSRTPGASEGAPALPAYALVAPVAVVLTVIVSIVTARRRIRRELEELDALAADLEPAP
jgi:hypothetical protein